MAKKTWLILLFCLVFALPLYADNAPASDQLSDNITKLQSGDPAVRRQAAEALGMLRNQQAIEPLRSALKDTNAFVRSAALEALGLMRATAASKDIVALLHNDPQDSVRQSAAVALNYVGDSTTVPDLIDALKDKSDGTRFAAANALGSLRATSAIPALTDGLKDKNPGMRRSCLNSLGRIGDKSVLPAVRDAMKDEDASIRSEAANICGNFNDKDSAAAFQQLLASSNKNEQLAGAGALAKIGSDAGSSVAFAGIKDNDAGIRMNAANVLGDIGSPSALSVLERTSLNDKDAGVKQVALAAIQKIKARNPGASTTTRSKKKKTASSDGE